MINIQRTPASHGLLWIKQGFRLIMRSPLQTVSMAMIFLLFMALSSRLPLEIVFLLGLSIPVWFAGYMRLCRALEYSEEIRFSYIFAGFEKRAAQLILLGGLALLLAMVIGFIVAAMIGVETLNSMRTGNGGQIDPNLFMKAVLASDSGMLPGLMTGVVLMFVLMLIMQYAAMLVFFDGLSPLQATLLSMRGTILNILPLTVYIMLLQVLAFVLRIIPYNLELLVLLPIGLTTIYVSYRDIFSEAKVEMPVIKPAE